MHGTHNHFSSIAYLNKNNDRVKQISFVTQESEKASLPICLQWVDLVYLGIVIKWDGQGLRAEVSDPEDEEPEGPVKPKRRKLK